MKAIFLFKHIFLKKYLNFGGFLSAPNLVGIYAKNADKWGRNFMCLRTLPGLPVALSLHQKDVALCPQKPPDDSLSFEG